MFDLTTRRGPSTRRLRWSVIAAAALAPALASAADLPTHKEPAAPPVVTATPGSGFYVGSFAGAEFGGLTTSPGASSGAVGFASGALLGYKWRYSPWSFGIEGDVSSNSLTQKFRGAGGAPPTEIDSVYSIHGRARLGYQLGDFEPFVAGGFVLSDIAQSRQSPAEFDGASSLRPGWTLGAGVDANLMLPIIGPSTIRAEYLYDRVSPTNLNLNGATYRTGGGEQFVRLGLIKYFDAEAPVAAAPFAVNWNGNYIGALGSYSIAHLSSSAGGFDANGGAGGFYTGRNWTFGQGVLGYEGSTSFGAINGDGPQPLAASTHFHDYFLSDVRGRAGWAFGRWLPFAAAGLAFDTSSQTDRANGNYRGDVFQTSATIGAGLDYMLTDRLTLRAEYNYAHSLGSITTKLDSQSCCTQTRDSQSFRLGIGYFLR